MQARPERLIVIGRIAGLYGVRGWVRVESYTDPAENILNYRHWQLRRGGGWSPVELLEGHPHGKGVVVRLEGLADREQARTLIGVEVAVDRAELPALPEGEFYWMDLVGLRVETEQGLALGAVTQLFETGANDVLVVKDGERERLIPFVREQVIKRIDLAGGLMIVDWDPEF